MKKIFIFFIYFAFIAYKCYAHNVHYPTYTEGGITYVKTGGRVSISGLGVFDTWDVLKVDKPYDRTITIPYVLMVNGEEVRVRSIRDNAFSSCISLDSLIITNGVLIDDYSLVGCKELDYLFYSFNGTRSGVHKYSGISCKTLETQFGICDENVWEIICNSLEKLIIRETTHVFGRTDWCKKLKTIICYAVNPPDIKANWGGCYACFESWQWGTITLYVQRESLEKYYFDKIWGKIDNIHAIDEIDSVSDNGTTSVNRTTTDVVGDCAWYSIDGTMVNKPTKGIYIKNGKKYIVK